MTKLKPQLYCTEKTEEPIFRPIKNDSFVKPKGGAWTSTYTPNKKYLSDWLRWYDSEMPYTKTPCLYILYPKSTAKVYTINSYMDLEKLHNDGFSGNSSRVLSLREHLDFEKIAKVYDAIHLTENGQWRTRLSTPYSLYGWDCESTLWFRNVFEKITPLEKTNRKVRK